MSGIRQKGDCIGDVNNICRGVLVPVLSVVLIKIMEILYHKYQYHTFSNPQPTNISHHESTSLHDKNAGTDNNNTWARWRRNSVRFTLSDINKSVFFFLIWKNLEEKKSNHL